MIRGFVAMVGLLLGAMTSLAAREFTVLVYNVENLFDVDGVAVYDDYQPGRDGYSPQQLLTKIRHIGEALAAVNDGAGPEIVLFQEIELDRTPASGMGRQEDFLARYADTTVEAMLTRDFSREIAGLPAEALLLKYLTDAGIGPYAVTKPELRVPVEQAAAINNVIFSRFPVRWMRQLPVDSARDVLVAGIEIEGQEFIVLNNHWKSGASSQSTEATRIQNASVVRAELEAILEANPAADVLIAGDLNSHYNQSAVFPDWGRTAVNAVLGSSTDEEALISGESRGLYNLWGELPLAERGSETYRGYWGTLMQMLITRGLYDGSGIQYIDNSFGRLILPGRNLETQFGTPRSWVALGAGAGFSDHLPIFARFRALDGEDETEPRLNTEPSGEAVLPVLLPKVDFRVADPAALPPADQLARLSPAEMAGRVGDVFRVDGRLLAEGGRLSVRVAGRDFGLYAPDPAVREELERRARGGRLRAVGQFGTHRGQIQFVIQDASWILN